jgi:hypothetical protein
MLEPDQEYVIIKLVNGEQLMGVCTEETDKDITVMFPMALKQYPVHREDGSIGEQITGGPFCAFATDRTFTFPKSSVMINKPLHELLVPFYVRMVNQYEKMIDVPVSMFNDNTDEEEHEVIYVNQEDQELDGYFIEGNDTIH